MVFSCVTHPGLVRSTLSCKSFQIDFINKLELKGIYSCVFPQSLAPVVPSQPPYRLEEDEDCYEEAEPFIPANQSTGQSGSEQAVTSFRQSIHKFSTSDSQKTC